MPQFVDAQQMHRDHPDTFHVPSDAELAQIAPGDSVKVCDGVERFWIIVTKATEGGLTGMVDNDLVCTDEHGLSDGDTISFDRENVYDILKAEVAA
ncbi:hypothetical protein TA3x_000384 [Tundrisphaera sp. TA3]|uniref:hypothetical protein n=1 Tax=Tundrisphaera sp. TA3 TaxID=3435775 RepID=UPI003EBAB778